MTQHNCGQCGYIKQTSPTQVFWLCRFWASPDLRGTSKEFDYSYVISHCHVQPEAPACPFFKEVEYGADVHGFRDGARATA